MVSHANIIRYCSRPFTSVEEMDETIIERWNKVVGLHDIIYVLGDFALTGKDRIIEIGKRLNGKKNLILGNHDGASIRTYHEAGFEFVSKYPILFHDFILLSHNPLFLNENTPYGNFYGHVHDNPSYKDFSKQSACVSVERINYTPISYEEIIKNMN